MNTILFILKMLGIAITGRATISGLFRRELIENVEIKPLVGEGPSKIEKRLTPHGRKAIFWAILGMLLSFIAQGIEQSLNIQRARVSAANAQAQLNRAEKQIQLTEASIGRLDEEMQLSRTSLEHLQRIVTQIEAGEVNVTFSVRMDDPLFQPLVENSPLNAIQQLNNTNAAGLQAGIRGVSSANIVGYVKSTNDTTSLVSVVRRKRVQSSVELEQMQVIYDEKTLPASLRKVISNPGLGFAMFLAPSNGTFTASLKPCFCTPVMAQVALPEIFFFPTRNELTLRYRVMFDASECYRIPRPISLTDFRLKLGMIVYTNLTLSGASNIECRQVTLDVGHNAFTFTNLSHVRADLKQGLNTPVITNTVYGWEQIISEKIGPVQHFVAFRFPDKEALLKPNQEYEALMDPQRALR